MIEISQRAINDTEKKILLDQIPGNGKGIEHAIMVFIFILFGLLVPLLLIDKYWFGVPARVELITLIPIVTITIFLTYMLDRKMYDSKFIKAYHRISVTGSRTLMFRG